MERREFVQRGVALAGGAAVLGFAPAELAASEISVAPTKNRDAPAPITESEREQRRDKAQRLMRQLGYSAMLIEPGANMTYFAGIEWGRSERLFAFVLLETGKPVVISPAFEQQRAEDQVNGRFDVRVWQEDQNPEELVADVLRGLGLSAGRLAIDPSARTFVFTELALVRPAMQFGTAATIINQCRGVKSAHEIEIMRYANRITLDVYREALKTLRVGLTQAELAKTVSDGFSKLGYQGG